MPDIATVLKAEISRIARKEVRSETQSLKKAVAAYRGEIAALKRRTKLLEDSAKQLDKVTVKVKPAVEAPPPVSAATPGRFSPKALAAQRARLQLSADRLALLVGVSGQSIYNWEQGLSIPHPKHLPTIAALKTLSPKQAKDVVESRRR